MTSKHSLSPSLSPSSLPSLPTPSAFEDELQESLSPRLEVDSGIRFHQHAHAG